MKTLSGDRKSASAYIVDIVDHGKSGRIDGINHLFYIIDLVIRLNGEDYLSRIQVISTLCMEERKPKIKGIKKLLPDLFVL